MQLASMTTRHLVNQIKRWFTFALACGGFAQACFFTLTFYGRVRKAHWVPLFLCAREGSPYLRIAQSRQLRVLDQPSSLLGVIYYLSVMLWASVAYKMNVSWEYRDLFPVAYILIVIGVGAVFVSTWLTRIVRERIQVDCPLCRAAHVINYLLVALLIFLG